MSNETVEVDFNFDNSYAEQLEGFYAPFIGDKAPSPIVIKLNNTLAEELDLRLEELKPEDIAAILSGGMKLKGAAPLAQAYAGHQFASFNPNMGDGRALLLGEVIDRKGNRQDIHLKGSGRTPYSRNGDGKAALGPMLREYVIGEAMHALGIPTTRALAVVTTGEKVMREEVLTGAVLARVASSHLRVGTFELFAAAHGPEKVKQLADYTIQRHFSELSENETGNCYLGLLKAVADKQAELIAKWMLVGFVHGVMNTDNMTISGETIDYGPCAFIDNFDLNAVYSSIDQMGRYAYGNQPAIGQWNLTRLAEALLPLIDANEDEAVKLASEVLNAYPEQYQNYWLAGMRAKLGIHNVEKEDSELFNDLYAAMADQHVDFTLLFRALAGAVAGNKEVARGLFDNTETFDQWFELWQARLKRDPMDANKRATAMNKVNPIYIPRNHKVEQALQAAEKNSNLEPFEKLMTVIEKPFEERAGFGEFAEPAPSDFGHYTTFCGT